jgi:hypothetical protein
MSPPLSERAIEAVETHRAHLVRKLDRHSEADLIRYALQRGIIPLEPWVVGGVVGGDRL